jgi:hypothetical protein
MSRWVEGPPNDQAGNPIPDRSSFPLLPSVQILFDPFCEGLEARNVTPGWKGLRMIRLETQFLIGSSFPLLPSVQILFDSYCEGLEARNVTLGG